MSIKAVIVYPAQAGPQRFQTSIQRAGHRETALLQFSNIVAAPITAQRTQKNHMSTGRLIILGVIGRLEAD